MYGGFPSFFDNFLSRDLMDWNNSDFSRTNSTIPAVNIRENKESFVIEVAAPGLVKQNQNLQGKLKLCNSTIDRSPRRAVFFESRNVIFRLLNCR